MQCREVEGLLAGYLYGELPPDEKETVERHLESCRSCREEWETIRSTVGVLRKWEDEEPPIRHIVASAGDDLRTARTGRSGSWLRLRRRSLPVLAAAAAALLLVAVGTEFSWEDGRFSLSFGSRGSIESELAESAAEPGSPAGVPLAMPVSSQATRYVTRDDFLRSQGELIRFVATLIRESEDRQMEHFAATLQEYMQEAELLREVDIGMMGAKVDEVERSARSLIQTLGPEAGDTSEEDSR